MGKSGRPKKKPPGWVSPSAHSKIPSSPSSSNSPASGMDSPVSPSSVAQSPPVDSALTEAQSSVSAAVVESGVSKAKLSSALLSRDALASAGVTPLPKQSGSLMSEEMLPQIDASLKVSAKVVSTTDPEVVGSMKNKSASAKIVSAMDPVASKNLSDAAKVDISTDPVQKKCKELPRVESKAPVICRS
ncbi:predicted protein [Arabidopsis lyrata subsp. lyrata]|uniref:Predicted protein n=1 Tax=Arabidopsis lyrata subsp. lyrata TaxID=81972 RepID=D7KHR4_ARALL|nr:predicted protein [Arabidopsis lyrata subsp. lyrata]